MPIYEYECAKCGTRYEYIHGNDGTQADVPECPACGGSGAKRLLSLFSVNHSPSFSGGKTCCGSDDPKNSGCNAPGSCCAAGK